MTKRAVGYLIRSKNIGFITNEFASSAPQATNDVTP